jgi:hypothetical protein
LRGVARRNTPRSVACRRALASPLAAGAGKGDAAQAAGAGAPCGTSGVAETRCSGGATGVAGGAAAETAARAALEALDALAAPPGTTCDAEWECVPRAVCDAPVEEEVVVVAAGRERLGAGERPRKEEEAR